jgi:hypothetical protein
MNGILYRIISKDDIPDEPDTLPYDVIEALRDEATPTKPIDPMPEITWVKSYRKWGFCDLGSHWVFGFYYYPPIAPLVILPPLKIIDVEPVTHIPPSDYVFVEAMAGSL